MTCRGQEDHCCRFGQECRFLIFRHGQPRCRLYPQWGNLKDNPAWRNAPVGQWFATNHPGYECKDWPQDIPGVMTSGVGLCCYGDTLSVNSR